MTLVDRIYGRIDVQEPVLLELLACPSVQRLKRIQQLGLPPAFHIVPGFTRHEHSVGVMLLLRHLGAPVEEQAAGLLHDVSHTAFSHIVDWFYKSEQHDSYQDHRHESFLRASEIPNILSRFGLSVDRIVDYHLFPLLEQDIPNLCADRVDYSLRQMAPKTAASCLNHLTAYQNRIAFNEPRAARVFADAYLHLQDTVWRGFEGISRYRIFVRLLERALELGWVSLDDFDTDDQTVLDKALQATDPIIDRLVSILSLRSLEHLPRENAPSFAKLRYVDPLVVEHKTASRLSKLDAAFAEAVRLAKEKNTAGIYAVSPEKTIESYDNVVSS